MLPESRLLGGPVYSASVADLPLPPSQDLSAAVETDWLASDQRRDRTVELLSTACADGRLSLEDFSTRVDQALVASALGELSQLEADLGPTPRSLPQIPAAPSARFVAIMSSTVRSGRWQLPPSSQALAGYGRGGAGPAGRRGGDPLQLHQARAIMGTVKVIVPEGINVEVDGWAVMGTKSVHGGKIPPLPSAPTVKVTAMAVMGEVKVVTKGPKKGVAERVAAVLEWLDRRHDQKPSGPATARRLTIS